MKCEHCGQHVVETESGWEHSETGAVNCWGDPPPPYDKQVATPEFKDERPFPRSWLTWDENGET